MRQRVGNRAARCAVPARSEQCLAQQQVPALVIGPRFEDLLSLGGAIGVIAGQELASRLLQLGAETSEAENQEQPGAEPRPILQAAKTALLCHWTN